MRTIVVLCVKCPLKRSLLAFFQGIVEEVLALMQSGNRTILAKMKLDVTYITPITCRRQAHGAQDATLTPLEDGAVSTPTVFVSEEIATTGRTVAQQGQHLGLIERVMGGNEDRLLIAAQGIAQPIHLLLTDGTWGYPLPKVGRFLKGVEHDEVSARGFDNENHSIEETCGYSLLREHTGEVLSAVMIAHPQREVDASLLQRSK